MKRKIEDNPILKLDGAILGIEDVVAVARHERPVGLTDAACSRVRQSRRTLEALADSKQPIYGINTGFGRLVSQRISTDERRQLQKNLILSHSAGVGRPLPQEVVRAAMLLRANSLAKGYSGIRLNTLYTLIELLNRKVHPHVPQTGSVGASGDLAPSAHIAAVLLGKGRAYFSDELVPGDVALERAGIKTIRLAAKEGLALINGTPVMCALLCLAVADSEHLLKMADVIAALSTFVLNGNVEQFAPEIQRARPHPGQIASADNLFRLLNGTGSEVHEIPQDAYSIRCIPQVHGAIRTALGHTRQVLETEINSATDNPLVFPETNEILSGGNFHGEPIALVGDYLKLGIAELGNISERRTNRLLHPDLNGNLPPFLAHDPGLNSGFMLAQYTAASLASENKVLVHPSTADSIPVSGDQEDHVSMGMNAALHLRKVVKNVETILGIELLCACQGMEFLNTTMPEALSTAYQTVRNSVPALEKDAETYKYIEKAVALVRERHLLHGVERVTGSLS